MLRLILFSFFLLTALPLAAQVGGNTNVTTDGRQGGRVIVTAVPFLLIAPDARAAAMGDAGVALAKDANAVHWNPAKLVYLSDTAEIALSYSPWLQRLVPDINLAYLSAFRRLDDRNAIGASLRYFSLGQIQLVDINQNEQGTYSPSEFTLDAAFARKFDENFSLATSLRFIYSNLAGGQFSSGQQTKAGTALAADVSAFYKSNMRFAGKEGLFSAGLNISNIGNKLGYVEGAGKLFLPTNLKVGAATTLFLDDLNEFSFTIDLNKLLVPTPPLTETDPETGETRIIAGRDPSELSVPAGIFGSFTDAPGGIGEELQEINYSTGAEYWYNKQFALRSGYFYETPDKGGRHYFTVGAGLKYNRLNVDFAYLLASQQQSPMANTLRFSLIFAFNR